MKYYQMSNNEYVIDTQPDMGGKIEELSLRRATSVNSNEPKRTIYITIPDNADFTVIHVETDSGAIKVDNCISKILNAETQSGKIAVNSGSVNDTLLVKSITGNIQIEDVSISRDIMALLEAVSGTMTLRLLDQAENYKFHIDTGADAQISIDGKTYKGGDFILHNNASTDIYFDSRNGALIIEGK